MGLKGRTRMTIDEAIMLLCQMYLPQFDEEEKQALTMATHALEEVKSYRDAEKQGLLLKLPCPLGTKIYCIHNGFIEEGMFFEMSCFKFKDYYKKSWFLTREEAEQALKQMGE